MIKQQYSKPYDFSNDIMVGKNVKFINVLNLKEETSEQLRNWRNNPFVRQWMYSSHLISQAEHWDWLQALKASNKQSYWVFYLDNDPIGVVYLKNINLFASNAEWGYYLIDSNLQGKGYARIMGTHFLDYVFSLGLFSVVYAEIIEGNRQSMLFAEKMGFKKENVIECLKDGQKVFVFLYKCSARYWESIREKIRRIGDEKL